MSAIKSGSSLRSLVLTPERIPSFFIPSCSPLLLSPRPHRRSPDQTRLLCDHDDDSPGANSPDCTAASPRFPFRLRPPRTRAPRCIAAAASESADADTDLTTRAAMSLSHVRKVTTPYGFRAVLAASPCTRRRESLFHRKKPGKDTESSDLQDLGQQDSVDLRPPPSSGSGPSRPVKALGQQAIKELKRPAAALNARSPAARRTETS